MNIDRGSFLMLVGTLAAGAAGGYMASEKRMFPGLDKYTGHKEPAAPEPPPPPPPVVDAGPAAPPPPPPPAAPTCNDAVGTPPEACPPPGFPTFEGGCGSFANTRCAEYKQGLKPKVATAAVDCLNKLKPHEQCDPHRVMLCGHLALMNSCPEESGPAVEAGANGVTATCQSIIDACGASTIAPSMVECKEALSGMNQTGRDRTQACMKKHCFDRGLVGCEALGNVPAK
jgi:hypothetical protein